MNFLPSARARAFTLVETVIASSALGAVGVAIYATLLMGTILFQKNAALNVSHEQARTALLQLQQDIHGAVSYPHLIDTSFATVSGTGPAAGIAFQVVASGTTQCQVIANAAASATQIAIGMPGSCPTPYVGERLVMPTYSIEQNVTAVTTSGTTATLTLSGSLGLAVTVSQSGNSYNVPCFLTQYIYYVVAPSGSVYQSGSTSSIYALNYYGLSRTQSYALASNGLRTGTPFSIPSSVSGAPNSQYVVALNLSIMNTTYNGDITKFNAANILLNGQVPVYSKVTQTQ